MPDTKQASQSLQFELGRASGTFFGLGLLLLLLNGYQFSTVEDYVRESLNEYKRQQGPDVVFDELAVRETTAEMLHDLRFAYSAGMIVGGIFLGLGFILGKAPRSCALTGLLLYLAMNGAIAVVDPNLLVMGAIIRVIILVLLVRMTLKVWANTPNAKNGSATAS